MSDSVRSGHLDARVLAAILARAAGVRAVYVSGHAPELDIWTVVPALYDETLDAVYERELELHGLFGELLATVDFHVTASEQHLRPADRVFEREC